MLRILNLPLAHNHNPLRLVRKSDCKPLLIRELPRSFASGSLAAAAINCSRRGGHAWLKKLERARIHD